MFWVTRASSLADPVKQFVTADLIMTVAIHATNPGLNMCPVGILMM